MGVFFKNLERCREDDRMCLLKAAKIIRQDLFYSNSLFNGNFDYSSQESYVSKSLIVLLKMILKVQISIQNPLMQIAQIFSQQQLWITSTAIRLHQLHKTTFMGRPLQYFNILQINLIYKYKIAYQ